MHTHKQLVECRGAAVRVGMPVIASTRLGSLRSVQRESARFGQPVVRAALPLDGLAEVGARDECEPFEVLECRVQCPGLDRTAELVAGREDTDEQFETVLFSVPEGFQNDSL